MFDVIRVDGSLVMMPEQLGTKRKFWFRDEQNRRMLFKAEERGTGEDWAEKTVCELCEALNLPHVHYELATSDNKPGVVCENCAMPPMSLVLGNQLLLAIDPRYPDDGRKYKVRDHTVDAVCKALATSRLPPLPWAVKLPAGIKTALDVFIGYVMLNGLQSNDIIRRT